MVYLVVAFLAPWLFWIAVAVGVVVVVLKRWWWARPHRPAAKRG